MTDEVEGVDARCLLRAERAAFIMKYLQAVCAGWSGMRRSISGTLLSYFPDFLLGGAPALEGARLWERRTKVAMVGKLERSYLILQERG